MKISLYETSKLLKGEQTYSQLGFSMLLARLRTQYAQDDSEENLMKCADEINAFISKFVRIMATDLENIVKLVKTDSVHQVLCSNETSKLIAEGKLLHIAGTEKMLRKLPKGNWVGGSTEYFITDDGGIISDEFLFVTEFTFTDYTIKSYDVNEIVNVANDAFDNGFSLLIMPYDSDVHTAYAENAASYQNIFMRKITGWISGLNLNSKDQTPIAVNGVIAEAYTNKAVVLHIKVPDERHVDLNIINIFEQDEKSPIIQFPQNGFSADKCFIDGKEMKFTDYLTQNSIDTKLPLVGDYSGHGVNISIKSITDEEVSFYGPVFEGIKYRIAKAIPDYSEEFKDRIKKLSTENIVFSCNCVLNFLYGGLEGKKIDGFTGPVTFGEIAYQLVNQTLVYITVQE